MIEIPGQTKELDKQFAEYLDGKSVAIVGSGPDDSKQGEQIDSHDVIVRIHKPGGSKHKNPWLPPPFVPAELHEHIGKKTHIFYCAFGERIPLDFRRIVAQSFIDEGGKFWCWESLYNALIAYAVQPLMREYIPIRNPSIDTIVYAFNAVGGAPYEGILVILDILKHNVKSVFLTGFDCYMKIDDSLGWVEENFNKDSRKDFIFLRQLCESYPQITVSQKMQDLFGNVEIDDGTKEITTTRGVSMRTKTFQFRDLAFKHSGMGLETVFIACRKNVAEGVNPILHGRDELHAMYEVAAGLHDEESLDGWIINCGIYQAGSACIMALALRDTGEKYKFPLIAIDNWNQGSVYPNVTVDECYEAHRKNIADLGLEWHIASVYHDNIVYLKQFWHNPIRVAFVDTSHHYGVVKQEIDIIRPHIVPGGWMLFHDYDGPEDKGIKKAVDELVDETNSTLYVVEVLALVQFPRTPRQKPSAPRQKPNKLNTQRWRIKKGDNTQVLSPVGSG